MKKAFIAIVFGVAFATLSASYAAAQSATEVTREFYAALSLLKVRGLPDQDQLTALRPFLSSAIVAQIERDRKKQAEFVKRHPEEKPPWIEGDLFSSLFEGPTTFEIGGSRAVSGGTHIDVKLAYTSGGTTTNWTDTAVLKKIGGKWRIVNILYKGKWQFKSGSSLINALK